MGIEMKLYYRPLSLESYAYLLQKAGEKAKVLAGGGYLLDAAEAKKGEVLIDLQALKLDQVSYEGDTVHVGGLCNLNMLMLACSGLPDLCEAIRHQAGSNVRNTLSLATQTFDGLQIGVIEPGAAADLILVDYHPITPITAGNLPWHILFGFRDGMVTSTMVAGKWLMKDRSLLTLDEAEIAAKASEIAAQTWNKIR